ncbi:putative Survival motor neuron-like protein 1 [Diplocarpon rosae]|nr:putative Survival motor neuron-like protein 1 [Diplocarpon rosae]
MALDGNASHSQIWDDSALVDSWNDALEEYKKYHSVKAQDENVEQLFKEDQDSRDRIGGDVHIEEGESSEQPIKSPRARKQESGDTAEIDICSQDQSVSVAEGRSAMNQSPGPPQHLIGQVKDEGLKNLLMSWYYAGYYTGLYEGQKQADGDKASKHDA